MSLVGDALRKARQEAAARDAERRGVLYSARVSDPPSRSNLGVGLVLGAAIAVVATVAGGSVAWWLLRGQAAAPDRAPTALNATPAVEPTPVSAHESVPLAAGTESPAGTGTAAGGDREPAASAASGPPATASTTRARPGADPVEADATASATSAEAPLREAAAEEPAADETAPQGFTGVEDGNEIYILEAELGGGRVLSLDYIVFRADDPFAEINGVEVHLGGVVSGFRVKAIERDRVVLSDGRRSVVLRTP